MLSFSDQHAGMTDVRQILLRFAGSIAELTRQLNLSRSAPFQWIREGKIPAKRRIELYQIACNRGFGHEVEEVLIGRCVVTPPGASQASERE